MKRSILPIIAFCLLCSPQVFAKETKTGSEANSDLNIFQVEPSIIDEKHYTSGENAKHQYVGKVLPYGAEIPSNDPPEPKQPKTERKIKISVKHFWSSAKKKDASTQNSKAENNSSSN